MTDYMQQIGFARKGQARLSKAEATLSEAVENIAAVLVENQDLFETDKVISVFARLDNLLKGMGDLVSSADALLDPEVLAQLRSDLAEHRATIEA